MKDEILKKLNNTDASIIPRYEIILPTGEVIYSRVQIRLMNTITQQGTPLTAQNLLSDDTSQMLGLDPATSTPDEAFRKLLGFSPKLSVTISNFQAGDIVEVKHMTTLQTVAKTVDSNGTATFDILEFAGYQYRGVRGSVSTVTDWLVVDTATLYSKTVSFT